MTEWEGPPEFPWRGFLALVVLVACLAALVSLW